MSGCFCQDCNCIIKSMWKHLKTIKQTSKSKEIKDTTLIKNVMVEDVSIAIDKHIERYKKKFLAFFFICKINSSAIVGYTKTKFISKRYNENELVNVYPTFYSKLKDVSHNHHLQMAKPIIEWGTNTTTTHNIIRKIT